MKLYLDGERERKVGNNHRRLLLGLSRLEIGPQDGGYEMDTWKLVSDFWIDSFLFFFFFLFWFPPHWVYRILFKQNYYHLTIGTIEKFGSGGSLFFFEGNWPGYLDWKWRNMAVSKRPPRHVATRRRLIDFLFVNFPSVFLFSLVTVCVVSPICHAAQVTDNGLIQILHRSKKSAPNWLNDFESHGKRPAVAAAAAAAAAMAAWEKSRNNGHWNLWQNINDNRYDNDASFFFLSPANISLCGVDWY